MKCSLSAAQKKKFVGMPIPYKLRYIAKLVYEAETRLHNLRELRNFWEKEANEAFKSVSDLTDNSYTNNPF